MSWGAEERRLAAQADPETQTAFEDLLPPALAHVEETFRKWLEMKDPLPLRAVLATIAAHRRGGDPFGLMLVGGSGSAKTEMVVACREVDGAVSASSIKGEAALLSGTPKKEQAAHATGGLLRQLGDHGILLIKDFTTILSLQRDTRASLLAALREIADGYWSRTVGSEGGYTLDWRGRCTMIAASTTAIDNAHGVLATFGNRFLIVRTGESEDRLAVALRAVGNDRSVKKMRSELRGAVTDLFRSPLPCQARRPTGALLDELVSVADVVSLARSPVERDGRGEIAFVADPDSPSRVAKVMAQLYGGALALGYSKGQAHELMLRVAGDSVPKLRRRVLQVLAGGDSFKTTEIAAKAGHPTASIRRALEDLACHGVVKRTVDGKTHTWFIPETAAGRLRLVFDQGVLDITETVPAPTVSVMSPPPLEEPQVTSENGAQAQMDFESPEPESAAEFEAMWTTTEEE